MTAKILFIAPYSEMYQHACEIVSEFNFPVNVVQGELYKGVELSRENNNLMVDVIISRGGTANNNTVTFNNVFIPKFESNSSWGDGIGGNKMGNGANETPSFTQSASGRMALCAIVVKNASASTLNIQNVSDNECSIYPNPASKILHITLPEDRKNRKVKIFNMTGQLVYDTQTKSSKLELNVKSLNIKGIVMVQIKSDNEISNHKVILQ